MPIGCVLSGFFSCSSNSCVDLHEVEQFTIRENCINFIRNINEALNMFNLNFHRLALFHWLLWELLLLILPLLHLGFLEQI